MLGAGVPVGPQQYELLKGGLYEGIYREYRGYMGVLIGIMEKKMETTIMGYSLNSLKVII